MHYQYGQYKQTQVKTADPGRLVLMVYEAAMEAIRSAKGRMDSGEVGEKGKQISRAMALVAELRGSLDMEQGGEIAVNLDRLYEFSNYCLIQANLTGQREHLETAYEILSTLYDGWTAIYGNGSSVNAPRSAVASDAPALDGRLQNGPYR